MSELMTERILGEKHNVEIILFLHMFGTRSRSEIYRSIATGPNMARKIENLRECGIVDTFDTTGSNRKMVRLTALGSQYAETLTSLENRTGGDLNKYRIDVAMEMDPTIRKMIMSKND